MDPGTEALEILATYSVHDRLGKNALAYGVLFLSVKATASVTKPLKNHITTDISH
jgi:hypothetical protein